MTRLLVAPDSFKGTFSAPAVTEAIAAGAESAGALADRCPVADGGEGTLGVLLHALGGREVQREVRGPLGAPVRAAFGLLDDGETAIVEMARASGLGLVDELDAEAATTHGTGELIAAAVEAGARRVLVALGGSATTDGGAGALEALAAAGGAGRTEVIALSDTATPFERAAEVFAPQKGADPAAVERLTARLHALAARLPRDPRGVPMTGAAGGLSGGLWAALGARLVAGAPFVLDAVRFTPRLADADAVITGEGRFDGQSLAGKLVGEVVARARAAGKPVHVVAGQVALDTPGLASARAATDLAQLHAAGRTIATAPRG